MTDRSTAVPAQASATAAYARIYEEQQPRLVAYARSLTRNAWTAEDLVAEAHFRVWRRLAEGHEIENVPAYLRTTVRHLAIASGTAVRETPRDPHTDERAEPGTREGDPAEQVSQVDLVVRVLGQLPERWVKALWLAEAEGQPLAAIGPQLGTKEGATAVLLHRAREGMRQAFLRTQTGAPDEPACQVHWARMPAYVRGAATPRQGERLLGHVDACDDCRARLAALMRANDRLPAIVAPALLLFALGGTGKFLMAFTAGSAGAAAAAGGHGAGLLHGVRQVAVGGSKAQAAVAAGAVVAGAAAFVLVIGPGRSAPIPAPRTPIAEAPVRRLPVAQTPAVPPVRTATPVEATAAERAPSVRVADAPGAPGAATAPPPAGTPAPTYSRRPAAPGDGKSTGKPSPTATPTQEETASPPADDGKGEGPKESVPPPTPSPGTPQPEPSQTSDPEPGTGTGNDEDGDPHCPPGSGKHTGHGTGRHGDHGRHRGGHSGLGPR
ncbi:sigma-70 family RNA polymerase sigma factor [Streptomyces sp. DSM 15324]|uniref:sigma-70 family RNA polymerase sigma factor n=1 Tax=Streptomyces sp. DSM 15324 TaxID=1739111 RepID=UPI000749EFC6|nr:sigma-70 family RNA polymerase sigma factor [Streptomyces sp. DSM 15324]KUO06849.1 RNA polymerase subunit sigma-70 [Streptomyces sp. DSM 15324]